MRCPRCSTELEPFASEGIQLDRCRLCFGIWFDRGELAKFNQFDPDFSLAPGRAVQGQPAGLRCPRGGGALVETPYAAGLSVIADRCPDCEGVWLDGDDIGKIREVMSGQSRARLGAALRLHPVVQRERELMKRREAWLAAQEKSREQGSTGKWLFMYLTGLPWEVHHRVQRFPKVTVGLIAANTLAFGLEVFVANWPGGEQLILAFGLVPDQLRHGQHLWTIVTSMFVHAGPIHLLGNMYFLYTFGDNVEDVLGALRFGVLYMLCGVLGGLAHFVSNPVSTVPAVGASGAISGVLGAYMFLFPRQKVQVMIAVFPMRLWAVWYLVSWLFFQLLLAFAHPVDAGVAIFAHLGGFLAGLLLIQGLISGRQGVSSPNRQTVSPSKAVRARPIAKTPRGPMTCPICGLVSPPTAEWCDCGYDFKLAE